MARNKSLFHIQGKLGDVVFFNSEGKSFARMDSSVSKDRIMTSPEYKRTREAMGDFGNAGRIAKSLRQSFRTVAKGMGDRRMTTRLGKVIYQMLMLGAGNSGQTNFDLMPNKSMLVRFQFNRSDELDDRFIAPHSLTPNVARNEVVMDIPDFDPDVHVNAPHGATHFKIILGACIFSDHVFNTVTQVPEPLNPDLNGLHGSEKSGFLSVQGMVGSTTTLTATIPGSPTVPTSAGLVTVVGIEFYKLFNGNYNILAQGNAMEFVGIF
ncbi:MAG: hypothetical protein H6581_07940 [Bacteroidia bacterium]|nr:hypothetical protein [Bacteroidia bacterium]